MIRSVYEGESLFEEESGGMAARTARFTIKLNLLQNGFNATDDFLDSWIKLSSAGRFGTTLGFRKRVCEGDHFQVIVPLRGKKKVVSGFVAWGYPILYRWDGNAKPVLMRVMPPGWHVSQPGRSILPPRFCQAKP
jgi:hypothetical protein